MSVKVTLIALLFVSIRFSHGAPSQCSRVPQNTREDKTPPDGRYRLTVSNNPVYYMAGDVYNITLEGVHSISHPYPKFTAFFLTVESINEKSADESGKKVFQEYNPGRFIIVEPALSQISRTCSNTVVNTNTMEKSKVLIQWEAPAVGGGCVLFRSTIIVHPIFTWYMDDGPLSKKLCPDDDEENEHVPLEKCNACDEAKYELAFEGIFSRNTHPKDFPEDVWSIYFSDLIGASHTYGASFWGHNIPASDGLKELAELGHTQTIDSELKDMGDEIRTIIKARGLQYPNLQGKTFAVFRVDPQHHLISFVTKLAPSPDWFVGVSNFELCLSNGSWVDYKEFNLYPYDAGTDSGSRYDSPKFSTFPPAPVSKIRPNYPNNPNSPFYDPDNREMRPLAKIYLKKQRLYEKVCDNEDSAAGGGGEDEENDFRGSNNYNDEENTPQDDDACAVTEFFATSKCSAQCGEGIQSYRRSYVDLAKATRNKCSEDLREDRPCIGRNCIETTRSRPTEEQQPDPQDSGEDNQDEDDDEEDPILIPKCKVTEWEEESCSVTCGKGKKRLTRKFVNERNREFCLNKYDKSLKMEKYEECSLKECEGGEDARKTYDPLRCPLTKWSRWSDCFATCGKGFQIRVRKSSYAHLKNDADLKRIADIFDELERRYKNPDFDQDEIRLLNITSVQDRDHVCSNVDLVKSKECTDRLQPPCENEYEWVCSMMPPRGFCNREKKERYFYLKERQTCGIFYDTCDTKIPFFDSFKDCIDTCKLNTTENMESLTALAQTSVRVDCQVSKWKYTPCNVTCGEGYRMKYKTVLKHPKNGGKSCPKNVQRWEKCSMTACEDEIQFIPEFRARPQTATQSNRCQYSEWGAWSPCNKKCGQTAIQIRTRNVLNSSMLTICRDRVQKRECDVLPCLTDSQRHYYLN